MLTYKSYYDMAPTYLCELITKKEGYIILIIIFIQSPISNVYKDTSSVDL